MAQSVAVSIISRLRSSSFCLVFSAGDLSAWSSMCGYFESATTSKNKGSRNLKLVHGVQDFGTQTKLYRIAPALRFNVAHSEISE